MTKRRPAPLGDEQKKQAYIREHLYSELRWLLDSATEWSIQDQLKLEIEGYEVQVYAMDSAFIHARNLFEFFLTETTTNHYGADQFLGDGVPLKSEIYTSNWKDTLHKFLMHASDRSLPSLLKTLEKGVEKHLNQMPVEFAREILRLWEKFEARLAENGDHELQALARAKRDQAIAEAKRVTESCVAQEHAKEKKQTLGPVF